MLSKTPLYLVVIFIILYFSFSLLDLNSAVTKYIYYNYTPSMPLGFYKISNQKPAKGSMVLVRLPTEIEIFYHQRGYVEPGNLLLKRIFAVSGDHVCRKNDYISINNNYHLPIKTYDQKNRKISAANICRYLKADEFFIVGTNNDHSLDSRYFGPISLLDIINTVVKL